MNFWLMKSEPGNYSIDDLARDKSTDWTGVRNYQARNFMSKEMKEGDLAIFYHSACEVPGAVGVMKVVSAAKPDRFQFDRKSPYFEERATKEEPVWFCVDVAFVEKFKSIVQLSDIRANPKLAGLEILKKGSRLSVTPMSKAHFAELLRMAGARTRAS
jgi:predicted RNA-binding protein with PUA-like domain